MLSGHCLRTRAPLQLFMAFVAMVVHCHGAVQDMEIRHDIRYLATFSAPSLVNPDDEKRFNENFQSRYRSRVVLLRPVTGQAYLPQLNARVSLFAVIKISAQREARSVAHELERALNGQLISLFPLSESAGSQESFTGNTFYLALEKRSNAFNRLSGSARAENMKLEADDIARDRNLLSYFAGQMLTDTPYHTIHILGFSGLAESEYETLDGLYQRSIRKLEAVDTTLVEKIR